MVKSFMTNMPDQCGAFLAASRIIERHQGNIVRVSYNKAVDAHALFLDCLLYTSPSPRDCS